MQHYDNAPDDQPYLVAITVELVLETVNLKVSKYLADLICESYYDFGKIFWKGGETEFPHAYNSDKDM